MVTGSLRQGNLSSPSINPSEPALKLYLFPNIATTLSFSRRQCWPQLPWFTSLRWSFAGRGGGFQAVVGQGSPCGLFGVFGFTSYPVAVGKGQSNFSQCSPQAFKFLLPFREGVSFLQDPTVIHWKDGNNFKLPGLYKLYWEWKLVGAPCGVCDYGSYNAHLSCWAVLVCALLAAEVFFIIIFRIFLGDCKDLQWRAMWQNWEFKLPLSHVAESARVRLGGFRCMLS